MSEVDMELLLSVVKGLGSVLKDSKGNKVYCKDDDCLRKQSIIDASLLSLPQHMNDPANLLCLQLA